MAKVPSATLELTRTQLRAYAVRDNGSVWRNNAMATRGVDPGGGPGTFPQYFAKGAMHQSGPSNN